MWGINSHGFSSLDPIPVSDLGKVHRDERKMQKCSKKGVETDKVRKKTDKVHKKVSFLCINSMQFSSLNSKMTFFDALCRLPDALCLVLRFLPQIGLDF